MLVLFMKVLSNPLPKLIWIPHQNNKQSLLLDKILCNSLWAIIALINSLSSNMSYKKTSILSILLMVDKLALMTTWSQDLILFNQLRATTKASTRWKIKPMMKIQSACVVTFKCLFDNIYLILIYNY